MAGRQDGQPDTGDPPERDAERERLHRERLYDEYLDAAVAGRVETPATFLARHGVDDAELADQLEQIRRADAECPRDGGVAPPAVAGGPDRALGDFRLIRRLGEGGMGVVYLAEQRSLGREVAVKVIRPELSRSPEAAARFDREAKAVARLRHPNIVTVYDAGVEHGVRYIAMEFVPGDGLDERLRAARARGRPLEPSTVVRWMADLARALHFAHGVGIVHRDVKPSNVRITPDGRPLLLDFGLARDLDADAATLTEAFVGSPFYVAPEQIGRRGGRVDARTDVYALGVVLYEAVTGRVPFQIGTLEEIMHDILVEDPPPPRLLNPAISRDLAVVIGKAMEKEAAARYASAAALADDLEALLASRPIAARPPGAWTRAVKWMRRRPGAAATLATTLAGVVVVTALLAAQRVTAESERRAAASGALGEAQRLITERLETRVRSEALEREYEHLRQARLSSYLTPEQDARIDGSETLIVELRRERERSFHRVLDLLERAQRLGADAAAVGAVRADLYLARYEESADPVEQETYLELVCENDPTGRLTERLFAEREIGVIDTVPTGADAYLFRYVLLSELEEGGGRRYVPVPFRETTGPVRPGTVVLRVVRDTPPLRAEDLVVEIAGHAVGDTMLVTRGAGSVERLDRLVSIDGVPIDEPYDVAQAIRSGGGNASHVFVFERSEATIEIEGAGLDALGIEVASPRVVVETGAVPARVWQDGALRDVHLPAGLSVRRTAAPLLLGPAAHLGRTPTSPVRVVPSEYLLVLRRDGSETLRFPFRAPDRTLMDGPPAVFALHRDGTTPAGFVRVRYEGFWGDSPRSGDLWIMEREVTVREYFEFLNAAETRRFVDASPHPVRFPRMSDTAFCTRDDDGRFVPEDVADGSWPAYGVSWEDARAYAAWRTRRARDAGRAVTFDLPTWDDWRAAAWRGAFIYGDRFHPKWVSSCYARPTPSPEPVMSFPIDESPYGVLDMVGSMREWLDEWYREDQRTQRFVKGGSWANGGPEELFKLWGGAGRMPNAPSGSIGFRLVMRREPAPGAGE